MSISNGASSSYNGRKPSLYQMGSLASWAVFTSEIAAVVSDFIGDKSSGMAFRDIAETFRGTVDATSSVYKKKGSIMNSQQKEQLEEHTAQELLPVFKEFLEALPQQINVMNKYDSADGIGKIEQVGEDLKGQFQLGLSTGDFQAGQNAGALQRDIIDMINREQYGRGRTPSPASSPEPSQVNRPNSPKPNTPKTQAANLFGIF